MSKEAMKLALETLERASNNGYSIECDEAITALREAQAEQPAQQEQLAATITISQRGLVHTIDNHFEDCVRDWPDGEYKLYTTPQPAQRKEKNNENSN